MSHTRVGSPRFFAFLFAQFLGAANDNAYKVTLLALMLSQVPDESTQLTYSGVASALFPIPFLLFSPIAGYIADRFPKHQVVFWTKLPEVGAMVLATIGLFSGNLFFCLGVLFVMAMQSAFFSPAKYGLLPEVFKDEDLSNANGILEMTTNIAILLGSVLGSLVYQWTKPDLQWAGVTFTVVSVIGAIAAMFVPRAPEGNPKAGKVWNLAKSVKADFGLIRENRTLVMTLCGVAYFYFLGAVFLSIVPVYGKSVLGMEAGNAPLLLAVLTVGIGLGSVLSGKLSKGRVELGLVPFGSIGLTIFAFDLALFGNMGPEVVLGIPLRAFFDIFGIGVASGFYIVPLKSLMQQRSPAGSKGRVVAFSNVLSFSAILFAAVLTMVLSELKLDSEAIVMVSAAITLIATLYILKLLPDILVRFIVYLVTNTIYKVEVRGEDNVPRGGALLVANHVSWVDTLLIGSTCDRMIRFMMFRPFYEWKPMHWFFKRMHVIPVSGKDTPEKKEESLEHARNEIRNGEVVCIFAEGAITRTGQLLKFRRGLERIAGELGECPIVPVYLDGLWGSIFSFRGGKALFKWPRRFPYPVTVHYGKPLPSTAKTHEVRQAIQDLSTEASEHRQSRRRTLGLEWVKRLKRTWSNEVIAQGNQSPIRSGELFVRAFNLKEKLFPAPAHENENIGICLPAGRDSVVANLAVTLAGRVPVNLDFDAPIEILKREISDSGVKKLLATQEIELQHLARIEGSRPATVDISLEDRAPDFMDVLKHRLMIKWLPLFVLKELYFDKADLDPNKNAAILFAMDRPDSPKGVELTHSNIVTTLENQRQVFKLTPDDTLLGLLPFSTSFGLVQNLWLPVLTGAKTVFADRTNLEGEFVKRKPTVLLLSGYHLKEVGGLSSAAFESVRHLFVGGEGVNSETINAFYQKHGLEPKLAYGCLECSSVVSINVPDFEKGRTVQEGQKSGTLGRPIPGISVKVVDPKTFQILPPESEGLLLVKGPNVMKGYLNDTNATQEVISEGWFNTGDLALIDPDGFISMTEAQ